MRVNPAKSPLQMYMAICRITLNPGNTRLSPKCEGGLSRADAGAHPTPGGTASLLPCARPGSPLRICLRQGTPGHVEDVEGYVTLSFEGFLKEPGCQVKREIWNGGRWKMWTCVVYYSTLAVQGHGECMDGRQQLGGITRKVLFEAT